MLVNLPVTTEVSSSTEPAFEEIGLVDNLDDICSKDANETKHWLAQTLQ
jgi:hypothetical protein